MISERPSTTKDDPDKVPAFVTNKARAFPIVAKAAVAPGKPDPRCPDTPAHCVAAGPACFGATSHLNCTACDVGYARNSTANTCTACTQATTNCASYAATCFNTTSQLTCATCSAGFDLNAAVNTCTCNIVSNGGFETNTLADWTAVDLGSGAWSVYSGTSTPNNGFPIVALPEGTYAATTEQNGPSSHILYQDLLLPSSGPLSLSFILYFENQAGVFCTPDSLSYLNEARCNQQYRVDIMNPAAPVDSVAPGDVLANVFQTEVGDPSSLAPTNIPFDLIAYAGTTVRLRFTEVDNQSVFLASVDGISLSTCA